MGVGNDTVEDYVLLGAPKAAKEKPVCQTLCSLLLIIFIIVGLGTDELSDGDIDIQETDETEDVDFDCGWQSVKFEWSSDSSRGNGGHHGGSTIDMPDISIINSLFKKSIINLRLLLQTPETADSGSMKYTNDELCDDVSPFDSDFCSDMRVCGTLFLVCGIIGIFCGLLAIIFIWVKKYKASLCYLFWQIMGTISVLFGAIYWVMESRCDEFEDTAPDTVEMEISVGSSITYFLVASGFGILGNFISIYYVCKRNKTELYFDYSLKQRAGLEVNNNDNNDNQPEIEQVITSNIDVKNKFGSKMKDEYGKVESDEEDEPQDEQQEQHEQQAQQEDQPQNDNQ